MPTTIGIDQVPREIVRPKWYSDLGYAQGKIAHDLLIAALSGGVGSIPTSPTPRNPGQLTFPSGATTRTSPQELAQLQAMGGVPSRQGDVIPFGQLQTGGVQYTQPTRLGIKPDVDFQLRQAQLQKAQQDLDPNSPMNQYIRSLTATNQPAPANQGVASTTFADSLRSLRASADAGDEQAVEKVRLILQLLE